MAIRKPVYNLNEFKCSSFYLFLLRVASFYWTTFCHTKIQRNTIPCFRKCCYYSKLMIVFASSSLLSFILSEGHAALFMENAWNLLTLYVLLLRCCLSA